MTAIIHLVARPVPGVGIAVPTLLPPIVAAIIAVLISHENAAPLAYIAGTSVVIKSGEGEMPFQGSRVSSPVPLPGPSPPWQRFSRR